MAEYDTVTVLIDKGGGYKGFRAQVESSTDLVARTRDAHSRALDLGGTGHCANHAIVGAPLLCV